jgi:hypothetical protein
MSIVIIIVSVIVILLFLLVFTIGFFFGLGRKKKDLKRLEKEQQIQKQTQESIIRHFLYEEKKSGREDDDESDIFPVKMINRGYKRIKKFLKFKRLVSDIKEIEAIRYFRKYFLSYIGIGVLVFGFGFFMKFTINAAYINIAGRFFIASVSGLLLILLSHSIRKKYRTFSSILMGGAFGLLYITFTISFHNYNVFSVKQIFLIYFILTLFSVILSLSYKRFELLLLTVILGFIAPFIAGVDYMQFTTILVYILLLDVASLVIAFYYRNILLRLIPSILTGVYLILWVYKAYQSNYFGEFQIGFLFSTLIYIVLIFISVAYNIRHQLSNYFSIEFSLPLAVNLIYYSVGMYMLNVLNPEFKGVFTALLAVFNILFLIIILNLRKVSSKSFVYLFGMISLLFLTLIPPVQLVGKTITMVWAIETVLLLWFSMKLEVKLLKIASMFLIVGLIAGFLLDVVENYLSISQNAPKRQLLLNKSFISGIMTSIGLGINFIILGKGKNIYLVKPIKMKWFRMFIFIFSVVALYFSLYTEILYRLTISLKDVHLINMYMGIFNYAFILSAMIGLLFINNKTLKIISGIIAGLSVILFFVYYLYEIIKVREHLLMNLSITAEQFNMHILLVGFLLFILYFAFINIKSLNRYVNLMSQRIISILLILILTTEIDHLSVIYNNHIGIPVSSIINNAHYFYYTMFWMVSAWMISVSALLFNGKELIRISMFIAIFTLLKLFIYDFNSISVSQRIISFITGGLILLFIAFVRQRMFEKKVLKEPYNYDEI